MIDPNQRYLNRELSWLAFNRRVLEEAQEAENPLLERVRFLSIFASNMEEFFMVRVAGLKTQLRSYVTTTSMDGKTPKEQLAAIDTITDELKLEEQQTWLALKSELEQQDIRILPYDTLDAQKRSIIDTQFEQGVFPLLTPLAVDPAHPFPFLPNKGKAIVLMMTNKDTGAQLEAVIPLPTSIPRFLRLDNDKRHYCLVEDVIVHHLNDLFPPYELKDFAMFHIIRDSELELEDEADDLVETFETALKRRRRGTVIHLAMERNDTPQMREFLEEHLELSEYDIDEVNGLVAISDLKELVSDAPNELLFQPFNARFPERIRDYNGDCFAAIAAKDILVHHPYESFDVVVQFLRQAARDPNVLSIKQTLYRTSKDSPIIQALIEAAEAGKSVTAMVELKARFDEEANIRWARDLERAGAQVVFGFVDFKTHTKLSLVTRREGQKIVQYAHFGTGNYHSVTAKLYTDLSYFTCDPVLCSDTAKLFNFMTGYATPTTLEKLAIAPINLRETLYGLIDAEIANAETGKPAAIWAKMNALVDQDMIDRLYTASQAGVKITLIIRGICSLIPGIEGLSENIEVRSIVGRFLEHARIYAFANGEKLPSRNAKLYMASADMMTRNLDYRIEALIPIENPTVHQQVLDQILQANIKDTMNSWVMQPDGRYLRVKPDSDDIPFSAHSFFMTNPSLSGRGSALQSVSEKQESKPLFSKFRLAKRKSRKQE